MWNFPGSGYCQPLADECGFISDILHQGSFKFLLSSVYRQPTVKIWYSHETFDNSFFKGLGSAYLSCSGYWKRWSILELYYEVSRDNQVVTGFKLAH